MKKIYTSLSVVFLFSVQILFAQLINPTLPTLPGRKCATAEVLAKFIATHPGAETNAQFESWINQKIAARKAGVLKVSPSVTVPVVFHIIHDNEVIGSGRNIPQSAVRQQILQINKDYANLSNSQYAVSEDMGIRFALAQNDPNGVPLAEPGIDRIDRNTKGWTAPPYTVGFVSTNYLTSTIKPNSIWDPARYLNIWVSQWEAGILGIATFPGSSTLSGLNNSETDLTAGVSVAYQTVGSVFAPVSGNCSDAYGKGKTLTHELGHFFGLRHIWGDAACGNDYCTDTPVHFTSNSGEPVHPKANTCGTADEMFENYMDYSDDIVSNTFTINQGDRMEAVFANSPRRGTLATSNVGFVFVTASNQMAFADCDGTLNITEKSAMSTCPKFTDINLQLNIEDRATAATTVTLVAAGTAITGVDYQLLTPTISFATGDNSKNVRLRIFDNGTQNANKTIILSYTIGAGGGITAGTQGQSININIIDDDAIRPVNNTTPVVTLLSEDFGTTAAGGALPSGWLKGTFVAGLNLWTVNSDFGVATGFTGNGRMLHITSGSAALQTAETALAAYRFVSVTDAIAITKGINTSGYKNIKVTFDYACAGEADANGNYDYGSLRYSTTAQTSGLIPVTDANGDEVVLQGVTNKTTITIPLPAAAANVPNFWLGFEWQNDNNGGTNPPFIIDNVVVTGEAIGVETVANQFALQSQSQTQNGQYVSNTSNIIASISNADANIPCITATVTSAGNGTLQALNTSAGSFQRSNKVIQLTPATANSTATYQATFYYTTAELVNWGAAVPNLKIVKVAEGVNLSSTLTPANAVVFTPAVDDQRALKGYVSYTINATGGFSQFVLASPAVVLPVLSLQLIAKGNDRNILLNWSTNQEINNKGFDVERSTDAVNFEKIGWVDGVGNSSRISKYFYVDNFVQPNVVYSYRLRQRDIDNRFVISEIRTAKINGSGMNVLLSPNPSSDFVKLFVSGATGFAEIKLYNAQGQVVRNWNKINVSSIATLDITNLAKGTYIFNIKVGEKTTVEKLIIN